VATSEEFLEASWSNAASRQRRADRPAGGARRGRPSGRSRGLRARTRSPGYAVVVDLTAVRRCDELTGQRWRRRLRRPRRSTASAATWR
jgi:hypothetical protein